MDSINRLSFEEETTPSNPPEKTADAQIKRNHNAEYKEAERTTVDITLEEADSKRVSLMLKNKEVLQFDFHEYFIKVTDEKLLPFSMKGALETEYIDEKKDYKMAFMQFRHNYSCILRWLAYRVLTLSRKNAKWIRNLISDNQSDDELTRAKIAIVCRAVSVADDYWLKVAGDTVRWEDVDVRRNKLNEVIAQVALHGKSLTLQGSLCSPELTTNGSYAKAWRRYPDGRLWLHKAGANGSWESKIEVMCSNLLDRMNVSHCYYKMVKDNGVDVCACPSLTSDNISIVDGMTIGSYYDRIQKNYDLWMESIDKDNLYKMWIVDYLICNRDRHSQNYGFYYSPDTMEIFRMHPLFDHNNAFDLEYMKDREAKYQFRGMSIREAAKYAMKRVDFHFELDITKEDFLTERQYKEFMWRANDLGVKIIYNPIWEKYCKKIGIDIKNSVKEFKRLHDVYALTDSGRFYGKLEEDFL